MLVAKSQKSQVWSLNASIKKNLFFLVMWGKFNFEYLFEVKNALYCRRWSENTIGAGKIPVSSASSPWSCPGSPIGLFSRFAQSCVMFYGV